MKSLVSSSMFLAAFLAVLVFAPVADAQILMFDFGATTPTGDDRLNSPGHFVDAIPDTDTTWNVVGTGDVLSGLLYADGTSAAGLSLRTGREATAGSGVVDYTLDPSSTGAGTVLMTGIYAGTSPGRDFIFQTGSDPWAIGVQIGGLAPGLYEIFLVGRNTNTSLSLGQNFYGAASAPGDDFNFGSLAPEEATNSMTSNWVEGNTYVSFTIEVGAGQVLNLALNGTGTDANGRGFLNSLQIVLVPEPTATAMIMAGGLGLLIGLRTMRRRRRSNPVVFEN